MHRVRRAPHPPPPSRSLGGSPAMSAPLEALIASGGARRHLRAPARRIFERRTPPGARRSAPRRRRLPGRCFARPVGRGFTLQTTGRVASESRWLLAFPVALARFFAVGCAEYIALRFAVGSPGLAPRSGYTRRRLGQARPPWPLGRGDRGLLAPGAAAPRGGYPAGRPVGFASRSPVAGGELVPRRAAEWLHPQTGWSGGRRHLRGRSEDFQQ